MARLERAVKRAETATAPGAPTSASFSFRASQRADNIQRERNDRVAAAPVKAADLAILGWGAPEEAESLVK